jgi:hypothetical protein
MSMTTQAPQGNTSPGGFVRSTDAVSRITGSSGASLVAATAIHVKLDELIAVTSGASDLAIGIERAKEAEIDRMRRDLERRDAGARDDESPSDGV